MNRNTVRILTALALLGASGLATAQTSVSEDFTSSGTTNPWYFFNGACLTASTVSGSEPVSGLGGHVPGCTTIATSYYNKSGGEVLTGGYNGTFPDPAGNATVPGQGALRFTNGWPYGYSENGGIVSTAPFPTGLGIAVTFKTVTYNGDKGGAGQDGADGISFYLMDALALNPSTITSTSQGDGNGLGSWGGSLGYSCSNSNGPYNGLIGAYLGVGIDEYGNFLNGANWMPTYTGPNNASGDNTALGYGYKPNRIGMRGAGSIAWSTLYATYYQSTYPNAAVFSSGQRNAAVQATCRTGVVADPMNPSSAFGPSPITILDYNPIPGGYVELPSTGANAIQIATESTANPQVPVFRGQATPIFYQLKISQDGLLSLSYAACPPASTNGCGSWIPVITKQSITTSNGPLPANFLFGFAGSTGGSTNIHEILCFKADPATSAAASAGASEKQSAKLETGVQAYFAYYNPGNGWPGRVTASSLGFDTYGNVIISSTPNWDASCGLTGGMCATTLQNVPVQTPTSRVVLTYSGTSGIAFEPGTITSAQTLALGDLATTVPAYSATDRVSYLRGDRTKEINTSGVGEFRARTSVLGDIIDSSPIWVGGPGAPYTASWTDRINAGASAAGLLPENGSTAETYIDYEGSTTATGQANRQQMVYVGSNDGLVHGFRSGVYNGSLSTCTTANPAGCFTGNDGVELLAYMPAAVVPVIHSQTTANVDFPGSLYGHNYFVNATPGSGDVFYNNAWHTWLVGGLGAGGSAIYALDVTNPSSFSESAGTAASTVIGEWSPTNITCSPACGTNLGNTYGTPALRRLHDGKWAMIFGNGFGSATGDAGIYIGILNPSTGVPTFYYLSTHVGTTGAPNGIAYVTPVDLDGDHITDYVYAGDLQGNVWRFDLTSTAETTWVSTAPFNLFKSQTGQPITTQLVAASGQASAGSQQQLMILFGTGRKFGVTNSGPSTYLTTPQDLYGVWDWNLSTWNGKSAAHYASVASATTPLAYGNLQLQFVTTGASGDRELATNSVVCWQGLTLCGSGNNKFGWYMNLAGTGEQIVYSPELVAQALTVNSLVPASNLATACTTASDTGFTYVISAMTGTAFNQVFLPPSEQANPNVNTNPAYLDTNAVAMQTNATGSSFVTGNASGTNYLVYETNQVEGGTGNGSNIQGGTLGLNLPPNTRGHRLSWIELR